MRPAPYYVRALAMALPAIAFGLTIPTWLGLPILLRQGLVDFRHLYTAGYMLRTARGRELYDVAVQKHLQDVLVTPLPKLLPFNHLSYEALLFVPLSLFPFRAAYAAFLALNLTLLALCYWVLRNRLAPLGDLWEPLPMALFLGFMPFTIALIQGQDSIILLTLLTASFLSLEFKELRAGLFAGLGIFKIHLLLPIVLLFFLWKRFRFFAGFAVSSTACLIASALIAPVGSFVSIVRHMNDATMVSMPAARMPNLRGVVAGIWPEHVAIISIVGTMAIFFVVALLKPKLLEKQFLAAITISIIIGFHVLAHDLSLLFLPMAMLLTTELAAPTVLFVSFWPGLFFVAPQYVPLISALFKYCVCFALLFMLARICDWPLSRIDERFTMRNKSLP